MRLIQRSGNGRCTQTADKAAMINAPHPAIWKRSMHSDRAQRKQSRYVRRMKMRVLPEMAIRRRNYEALVDRKSTRLNSSHVKISYAVFCLKKKKQKKTQQT